MQIVDKIVEMFRKHKGKTLVDVRGFATALVSTDCPDKSVTFTFDFKNETTGAIDGVIVEAAGCIEGKHGPSVEPDDYESADLRIVSVRNLMAGDASPEAEDLTRSRSAAMTGDDEPGRSQPWPGKPPEPETPSEPEK